MLGQLTKKCHEINDQLVLAKIKSLILDIIHQISVIDLLLAKNVRHPTDWSWFKQLKFSMNAANQGVGISMADANF